MKVGIGDIVETEFGRGPVVAITKQWLIHSRENEDDEICVYLPDNMVWVPAEFDSEHVDKKSTIDLPVMEVR